MIKLIDYKTNIRREEADAEHYISSFVADSAEDIEAMNEEGSEYLHYPAGTSVICLGDGKIYILNADETEYIALGGE